MISFSSRNLHKIFFVFSFLLGTLGYLYAEEDEAWIFAAAEFESNIEEDKTAKLIPQYILQNFPKSLIRTVTPDEQYRQAMMLIDDEIRNLYEDLQSTVLEKDSLVLNWTNNADYEEDYEKKEIEIEDIYSNIQDKNDEKSLLSSDTYLPVEKNIALWNDNAESLYELKENMSFFYPTNINGLITGNITHTGSFMYVEIQLTLYPGAVIEIEITDADEDTAIQGIAKRVSEKIYTSLSNKTETEIVFSIEPQEANENSIIHINGQLIKSSGSNMNTFASVRLPIGVYEFYIECPGYEGLSVTHSFTEEEVYNVDINLKKEETTSIAFSIPAANGSLFINTQKMTQDVLPPDDSQTQNEIEVQTDAMTSIATDGIVTINDLPALGEFVSTDGIVTWFLLDVEDERILQNLDAHSFTLKPETKNYSEIIERNRKRMYNSYAALIVSLPLYFISYGQHLNEYNSWATLQTNDDKLKNWELARDISMGVSIGLGINFLTQLGIYIYSVNAILPEEVTPGK